MIFFFTFITCLLSIVLILQGENLSWSLMGVKGLRSNENSIKVKETIFPKVLENVRLVLLLHMIGWEWCELFGPIIEQSKEKTKQTGLLLTSN